jgi:hypothetical protein
MAIMATDTGGGGDFSPMPPGNHLAVCNMVVDLGKQRIQSQMYGDSVKHQIYLRWETPHEELTWTDKDGNEQTGPRVIGKTYTLSLHENANLRADLESWRSKAFTEDERRGFDVAKLLGAPCMLNVIHADKNGKTYANIASIGALPKGTAKPESKVGLLLYDDEHDGNFEKLPEWLQKKVDEQIKDEVTTHYGGSSDFGDDLDDEIPF